jgi:hypothetical protein
MLCIKFIKWVHDNDVMSVRMFRIGNYIQFILNSGCMLKLVRLISLFVFYHKIGSGANPASYSMDIGDSFRCIKQPERDADHSSSSRSKDKSVLCFIKYRVVNLIKFKQICSGKKTITLL